MLGFGCRRGLAGDKDGDVGGRLDDVFSGSPERSVCGLLRSWWRIECPGASADAGHPAILHRLWTAGAHRLAWGHQDILLPPDALEVWECGAVEFFVENQSVWRVGYQPDGSPDPPVVVRVGGASGRDTLPLEICLHEFLARTLVIEAVFGAAWWTSGHLLPGVNAERWLVWPELVVDPDRFTMPALYSDGSTLCFAFDPSGEASAFYGAASREELASSTFAELGSWFGPEEGGGPLFARS